MLDPRWGSWFLWACRVLLSSYSCLSLCVRLLVYVRVDETRDSDTVTLNGRLQGEFLSLEERRRISCDGLRGEMLSSLSLAKQYMAGYGEIVL